MIFECIKCKTIYNKNKLTIRFIKGEMVEDKPVCVCGGETICIDKPVDPKSIVLKKVGKV